MLLIIALTAGLGMAGEPAAPPAGQVAQADKKPVLKCEKIAVLGSRMPVRVCRTPEQIKQAAADARDTTNDFQKINPERVGRDPGT